MSSQQLPDSKKMFPCNIPHQKKKKKKKETKKKNKKKELKKTPNICF